MPEVTVPHISGQQGELGVDVRPLPIPSQEAMNGKGSAKLVQMGRSVVDAAMILPVVVHPEALENSAKVLTGPIPSVRPALGHQ